MTNTRLIKEYKKRGYEVREKAGKRAVLVKDHGSAVIYQLIENGKTLLTRSKLKEE